MLVFILRVFSFAALIAMASCGRKEAEKPARIKDIAQLCKGYHICQSAGSIGHQCNVQIMSDNSADASMELKWSDCCKDTTLGGRSIDFKFRGCSIVWPD